MQIVTSTDHLARACGQLAQSAVITIDTEFMRENTYWPRLCLVQVASPETPYLIDPLAPGLDLAPLLTLLKDRRVLKVFHAARQDLEIFYHLMGEVPSPIFDTQVAAMVCGFGEQVGYDTLANALANADIDKLSRYTDWSHRPLSEQQIRYATADVTYLHVVYAKLHQRLAKSGRESWLGEEMAVLTDHATYDLRPENAWARIKTASFKPRFLAVLRGLAEWREREAQARDLPRGRIVRDEALIEIAAHPPRSTAELARVRGLSRGFVEGALAAPLLAAVEQALNLPESEWPKLEPPAPLPRGIGPLVDLLKVLLRLKCEEHDVAQKLVASVADLERVAADDEAEVPALQGWRRQIFGETALQLKHGRIALSARGRKIRLLAMPEKAAAD
jgi:ribonuclease D